MNIFNKSVVTIFRLVIAFFAFAGTSDAWGHPIQFVFFTTQSNVIIGIIMVWAALATLLDGVQPPAWLKGCLTLYIVITGIVAWLILAPSNPATAPRLFGIMTATMVHIIVPIASFADFILCDTHHRFKWHYPLSWLIYFPVYIIFVELRGAIAPNAGPGYSGNSKSSYPYPFMDFTRIGWNGVFINAAIYLTAFLILGFILFGIDRALPEKSLIPVQKHKK